MVRKLFLLISSLIVLISCDKIVTGPTVVIMNGGAPGSYVVPKNDSGEFGIVFGQYSPATKANAISNYADTHYNDFSLFTWNSNNEMVMNPFLVSSNAQGYYYEGVNNQELQYFKNNTNHYEFIGVIPTDHTMALNNGVVSVEALEASTVDDDRINGTFAVDSPEEFLFTYKKVEKANYGSVVELPFRHGNALLYLGFSSDRNDTKLIDYVSEIPGTSVAGTMVDKRAKMFDEMASGQLVSYALVPLAGDQNGYYAGFKGNYFNLNPYHGAYNYVSKERLAELMPLVNAQFIYTDENCGYVDKWEYGVNKQYKIFLKFADGVDVDEFAAGNDAFWTNLTDEEKARMQNHHDSGCRIIRIEQLSDGNYFAWGESYGTYINYSGRDLKIMQGGTIGTPTIPAIEGIRVFSANVDNTHYVHLPHTMVADAAISDAGVAFSNRTTSSDVITYSLPSSEYLSSTPVFSPTTFYAIPGDENLTHFVVKLSYIYNGLTVYDVRVPIQLPANGLEAGKYYKYIINITSTANGTNNPEEASDDKNEIDAVVNPVISVNFVELDYVEGETKTINI